MSRTARLLCFTAIALISNQLGVPSVESKVQLCQPPPKWTVNNGTDVMASAVGNVTLVTLINSSYRFGLKQASSLENMLRFLRKSGLKAISFIAINSKDSDAKKTFKELSAKVSFGVYQETASEEVWSALDGGKDDMFLYDRCGLLTYYIPFPLSIIHAQQPILQAALLSTYFDNPCADSCNRSDDNPMPTTTSPSVDGIDATVTPRPLDLSATVMNLTFDRTLSQDINDTNDNRTVDNAIDFKNEHLLETQINDSSILSEEFSGSGSGDDSSDSFIDDVNVLVNEHDNHTDSNRTRLPDDDHWKVLNFFNANDNRTDKDVFDEIYNKSVTELDFLSGNITKVVDLSNQTTARDQNQTNPIENSTQPIRPLKTLTIPKRNRFSFFNSHTKCDLFNASMCAEWSTDRLLRVRLCCLSEMLGDDDSGFGCGHLERGKCNRMLPLIKCCLKDFSQLLDNYYQSVKASPSPRPSRQRLRN